MVEHRVVVTRELSAHSSDPKRPRSRLPDWPPTNLAGRMPPQRDVPRVDSGATSYAEHLVTMVSLAHLTGHDDLVWLGHQPAKCATKIFHIPKEG